MYSSRGGYLPKKDAPVTDLPDCPSDSISAIAFNSENTHVAVASWDGSLRVYRLPFYSSPNASCTLEKTYPLGKPVLSCCFFGTMVIAGLVDGSLAVPESNNTFQAHEGPVKGIRNYNNQFIITGSFDCTLKFWDMKSPTPLHTITLPAKVYSMDLQGAFMAVVLSNKNVITYDMNNVNQSDVHPTRFTYSVRSVGCHKDQDAFAVGGIEAKVETFSRSYPSKKMIFRCHRVENKLYAVNTLRFYPRDPEVLVTGGSDGSLVWFDRMNRSKMCVNEFGIPITAGEFSSDGKYFVFGIGDDWSKGYTGASVKPGLKMIVVSNVPGMMSR